MHLGFDPQDTLEMVWRRQEETRDSVRREAEARRLSRPSRGGRPVAFKVWRLHVMVWLGEARGA